MIIPNYSGHGIASHHKIKYLLQDDNRYNSSRGAHLNLKRAEKARILVNKIPGIFSNYYNGSISFALGFSF